MEITEVRILSSKDQKIKAFASVTFDNTFVVHNIKILEGIKGIFIAMPSKKVGSKYIDLVHPTNTSFRNMIQDRVLLEFRKGELNE